VERLQSGLPPGQILLVSATAVDKRSVVYKAFDSLGEVHEYTVPDKAYQVEEQARTRAVAALKAAGITANAEAFDLFLDRVGTDARQIGCEVDKLAIFLGDRRAATEEDVRKITSASRGALAWDLADAVAGRQLPRALEVLRQLLFQKEAPVALIALIENRLRDLSVYRKPWTKAGCG